MDQSAIASMFYEATKTQILANWESYLSNNIVRLRKIIDDASWDSDDPIMLVIRVDPNDLSVHEVGFCNGCGSASLFSYDRLLYLQIPFLQSMKINALVNIGKIVDKSIEEWFPFSPLIQTKE